MPELTPASEKLILVIDDDDSARELMELVTSKEGFRVATAVDGAEGLQKAQELKPDLILLDLRLPKLAGVEILRMLQTGAGAEIPVIIVTGHSGDQTSAEAIRREPNVKGYFEKPVNPAALGMNLHMLLKTTPPMKGKPAW